jgi:hypothetical protein
LGREGLDAGMGADCKGNSTPVVRLDLLKSNRRFFDSLRSLRMTDLWVGEQGVGS